jgi:putative transposase
VLTEHSVPIAPRTFYAWAVRAPSKRALWDATVTEILAGYYEPDEQGRKKPESLYGSLKMWAYLQREGIPVAKSTVERLMRKNDWQGVRRQKTVRTTVADQTAARPPDLVDRRFGAAAPNRLLVADFTYVKLVTGAFVYVAFVIDAYARAIVGWEASGSKQTRFVDSAIRQAVALRSRQGHPIDGAIHHSDAGSQYTSVRFGETLNLSGLRPSVGSVGDAYDNALAETTIGLYKNECIRTDSPFRRGLLRTLGDVELITADYVAWYNQQRLMHRLGRIPPTEAEAQYYSQHVTDQPARPQNPGGA